MLNWKASKKISFAASNIRESGIEIMKLKQQNDLRVTLIVLLLWLSLACCRTILLIPGPRTQRSFFFLFVCWISLFSKSYTNIYTSVFLSQFTIYILTIFIQYPILNIKLRLVLFNSQSGTSILKTTNLRRNKTRTNIKSQFPLNTS